MRILRHELQAQATEIATNPTARILAANDRGVTPVGGVPYRFFELYGSFPNGPFGATTLARRCGNADRHCLPIDWADQRAAPPQGSRTRLWRGDGTRSLAFGPVVD